jgi:hypothetical protein
LLVETEEIREVLFSLWVGSGAKGR